ncbi:MAG: AAA family ATPase [Spirulinaceae cyanobacterium]
MNSAIDFENRLVGYRLAEQLYNSSITIVYRAIRVEDEHPVVVKFLKRDYPNFQELLQFRNQYTITKNLDLPGVIKTYALEYCGNSYALIVEDFGGISLKEYTKTHSLQLDEFLAIALQLSESLNGLYHNCIIHKDIKPANILIHPETKQVKLIDFSIASLLPKESQEISNPNVLEGTLAYISPEQTGRMNRGIDYRTDFYSLGVTFYELLTGKLPFTSNEVMELVHCHLAKTAEPFGSREWAAGSSDIPEVVEDIVMKLMAKNAEERYQSALGLKYDLEQCLSQWQETGTVEPFELGQRDIGDRFTIPEKLYGREAEVQTLLDAFERVAQGATEMMLVAGFSGIGKTVVVNEVHKPIVKQRGYFIKGKFDQFNRNIPFSAFVQAFRDLMGQLLGESDTELANWKAKILEAVGGNGQLFIEVIPELEQIIGHQPPVTELSGSAAQNRFNLLFQKFITVFTTPTHPLVMFLDDLQWADAASLGIIKILMGSRKTGHLLLVGAYRDNEVSPTHPLIISLAELEKNQAIITTITLKALTPHQLNQLVAETLSCSEALAQPLSELVSQKTQGNPFFTTQFLTRLHKEQLLTFNPNLGSWQCDLIPVVDAALTDNVVEFMAARLQQLPEATQKVLKLAACIGNKFDLETLAVVCEEAQEEVATALWAALQEGLVLPVTESYKFFQGERVDDQPNNNNNNKVSVGYRFLHDRIQQAAYSLIPDQQKETTHYHIGQLLLQKISPEAREDRIFELINQFNYGKTLITEQQKRDELAQLNLIACRKARATIAYQAGREYAKTGLFLLGENAWQQQYEMSLEFHNLAAELASLCGDFEAMEQFVEAVINNTQSLLEQVNVHRIRIIANVSRNQFTEAIAIAQQFLGQLAVTIPDTPTPSDIQQGMVEVDQLMKNRAIADLANLPAMTDVEKIAIIEIASSITPVAYMLGSPLFPFLIALAVKLSIQYGNTSDSAFAFACYGIITCNVKQDVDTGVEFGQLALDFAERLDDKTVEPHASTPVGLFVWHRKAHLKEVLPILQEGYTNALEVGNLEFAGYNAYGFCLNSFLSGQPLASLEPKNRSYCKSLVQLNQLASANYCRIYWQSILNLLGATEQPSTLSGEAMQETELLPLMTSAHDLFGISLFYLYKLMLCYLFEEVESAQNQAVEVRSYLTGLVGTVGEAVFYVYDSLTALSLPTEETSELLQQVEQNQRQLQQQWVQYAPMNYQHKFDLVEAEKCRVLGEKVEAIELYDKAIAGAKKHEYIQEEALANELAAKFYLDWGKQRVAAGYMQEAYYCYGRWGAKAKTDHLESNYPHLLTQIFNQEQSVSSWEETVVESHSSKESSSSTISLALDFAAVLKASQSLSKEIELNKLLATLLKLVIENAGANKCVLMLNESGQLQVEAVMELGKPPNIRESVPIEASQNVALHLVNTVKRTLQSAVIMDATVHSPLSNDSYIQQHQPKSLLCTPILYQGKLLGLVYLENNLVAEAFTADRVEIVNLLCTQAAISIENAQLYQQLEAYSHTLEEKVEARTSELRAAQQQMISQEKLASLGALTAGVAHELRNPLNFVNNYAEGSTELSVDLLEAIEEQAEVINSEDLEYLKEIVVDLKDNAAAIKQHGQRAASIIFNMMQHARSDDSGSQKVNLNKLLEEARQLAYHSKRSVDNNFNITFSTQYDDSIGEVEVFSSSLNRAFINLIDNACYAAWSKYQEQGKTFVPTLSITTKKLTEQIEIRIRDNGAGIPAQVAEKIFEPFFTTKPTGEGTGLGLSLTHEIIVGQHLGTLQLETEPDAFSEFIITLPVRELGSLGARKLGS